MYDKGEIYSTILSDIVSGRLAPGSVLESERQLSLRYGVSKTVIHAVYLQLQQEGFITISARKRATVSSWMKSGNIDTISALIKEGWCYRSPALMQSLMEFRVFSEGRSAALAAQRASDEEIAELESALEMMKRASDSDAFADANIRYHHMIFSASGNIVYSLLFAAFIPVIEQISKEFFSFGNFDAINMLSRVTEHVKAHDAVAAEYTMNVYSSACAEEMKRVIAGLKEQE